jgi:transcriptional regulator with XRE-family HTH domain
MNPRRLKSIRQARGMTLEALSEAMGGVVTKQALSKYETGLSVPSPRVLISMAKALSVKAIDLVAEPSVEVRVVAFRKRASLAKGRQQTVEHAVALDLERRVALQDLVGQQCSGAMPLGQYAVSGLEEIESAAEQLRDAWNLGRDPIGNVVEVLEDHCVHVIDIDAPEKFDGMSAIATVGGDTVAAAVVTRSGIPGERQRLNLSHELGHLALSPAEGVDHEKAAYRFGAAFLAPRETLLAEVGQNRHDITPDELFILKRTFGLSLAALVYRLHDLGVIGDRYYQDWWKYIGSMEWRMHEPHELPPEEATWLPQSTLRAYSEGLLTEAEAEGLLGRPLENAGPRSRRRAFAGLSREQRVELLAKQAKDAAGTYPAESDGQIDDDIVEY